MIKAFADFQNTSKLVQDKACDRVEVIIRSCTQAKPIERMVDGHQAIDQQGTVVAFDDVRLFAVAAQQVARNGFEKVCLGDDAIKTAIFVNHDRQANRGRVRAHRGKGCRRRRQKRFDQMRQSRLADPAQG